MQVHALNIYVTTGLGVIGLPNTKIIVGGGYLITSIEPNGPNKFDFKELSVYQSFTDRAVEIKAAFTKTYIEYFDLFAGGSPTLTNGFSSLIPVQVGLSAEPGATPALNIGLNGKHGLYAKFGVQRSSNPLGDDEEVRHNGIGLAFTERHARPLVIGELGIKQESAFGQRSFWPWRLHLQFVALRALPGWHETQLCGLSARRLSTDPAGRQASLLPRSLCRRQRDGLAHGRQPLR